MPHNVRNKLTHVSIANVVGIPQFKVLCVVMRGNVHSRNVLFDGAIFFLFFFSSPLNELKSGIVESTGHNRGNVPTSVFTVPLV